MSFVRKAAAVDSDEHCGSTYVNSIWELCVYGMEAALPMCSSCEKRDVYWATHTDILWSENDMGKSWI